MPVVWQATIVGALAGLVGFAELLGRYRSDPSFALKTLAAWTYIGINAAAGVGALYLVRAFNWRFGQTTNVDLWRILVAGFGAVALFRSSLFTTRVGSTDVNVGPSIVLGTLLDACDRNVDRKSADRLSDAITDQSLAGLDPSAVMTALPVLCLALMQNFAAADQALLGTELLKVRNDSTLTADTKMRAVIVQLAKFLGQPVVAKVLEKAHDIFATPVPPSVEPAPPVPDDAKAAVVAEAIAIHQARTNPSEAPPPRPGADQPHD